LSKLIRLVTSALLLTVVGISTYVAPVTADQLITESNITLRQVGQGDLKAVGHLPTLDIWFPGFGDYELGEGSYLSLAFDHSPLVRAGDSTITVEINDVPVSSLLLDGDNAKRSVWNVALPKDRLRQDINHVILKYYMRLRDGECIWDDDTALYSTVYGDSYIHYEYLVPRKFISLPPPDLSRFPEPFLRVTSPAGRVAVIVPDQASASDFSAAASVVARFGQLAGSKPLTATLYLASQVDRDIKMQQDLVVIGQPGANPVLREIGTSLPLKQDQQNVQGGYVDESGSPIDQDAGVIQEIISPWDQRFAVLVVSGGSDEGVRRAARAVSSQLAMKSLQGPYAIVTKAAEALWQGENPQNKSAPVTRSLQQMGLQDLAFTGVGEHAATFSFDAPAPDNRGEAYFDLVITHSPLLDPSRSSLTVSLNGVPMDSLLLQAENSERTSHHLRLPTTGLRAGPNVMTVKFSLYSQRADWRECAPLAPERAWVVLHADSRLVLPAGGEDPPLNLAGLPYPFVRNGLLTGTFLVLPDDPAAREHSLQVAVTLGRQALGDSTEMGAGLAAQLADEVKREREIVLYGVPSGNAVVADVAAKLPLSLGKDAQRTLQRPELVLLGVKDAARLGIMELVPSPWNASKALLVISGTSSEMLLQTLPALGERLPDGNVATVNAEGKVAALRLMSEVKTEEQKVPAERRAYTLAVIPPLVGIVGLLGLIFARTGRNGGS